MYKTFGLIAAFICGFVLFVKFIALPVYDVYVDYDNILILAKALHTKYPMLDENK